MSDKDLVGVKGWLLFLVIWLSAASIIGAFTSYSQFWLAEIDNKYITTVRAYQNYKNVFFAIVIISVCSKIYAAYKLYSQHENSSVTFAKYTLWIFGPIASAMIAIFSLKLNYGPLLGENIKYTFIHAIFALIWTLYLNKSDRVYNTYLSSAKRQTTYVNENELAHNEPVKESYLNTVNNVSQGNSEKKYVSTQKPVAMNQSEKIMNSNDLAMNSDMINEDELYLQATKEVDEGNPDQALWAKCMALCEGDDGKAKYRYIKDRVERLRGAMVKENEESQKLEILQKKKIEEEKHVALVNSWLSGNYLKLNEFLNKNNYNFYKDKHGPYVLKKIGEDKAKIFKTEEEFKTFIANLIPKFKEFDSN